MKVLVTGGAGYIGSVVTEELLNDGHEAIVYDSLYKGHREAVDARATFIEADLMDGDALLRALKENQNVQIYERFAPAALRNFPASKSLG
ncbi:MAG: NAD-dependent epimerase/dehydratase family protein [Pyrinomonadaceae bacterium]